MRQLVYCLYCTICGRNCDGRSSWLEHLCQDDHQKEGRRRRKGVPDDEGVRECTIVVFCSFSLRCQRTLLTLLEKLSKISKGGGDGGGPPDFLVTDLDWWPERDTVAYVQFESMKAVDQLFNCLGSESLSFQVDNKLVQLKKAVDMLKLEWKALLPHNYSEPTEIITSTNVNIPNSPAIPLGTEDSSSLQTQYRSILKSTEIPEENFNYILKIVNHLKEKFQQIHPSGQVVIFRNYHFRLKTMGTNTLLLFAYIQDNPDDPHGYLAVDKPTQESIFNCLLLQNQFPGGAFHRKHLDDEAGTQYQNATSGLRLNIVTHPLSIVETQLSLLVQYLCKFDPHVKPLLTLIHFWARSHGIHLGNQNISLFDSLSNSPDPVALEWLVILFMSREGFIPTPREILERPHKPLLVTERKIDVGFSEDPHFPKNWRQSKKLPPPLLEQQLGVEETPGHCFILEVVNLAQKFFQFYSSNLEKGCWVVNPKDGEICKRVQRNIVASHLSQDEIWYLTRPQNETTKAHLLITNHPICILNPLYISWRLSFCSDSWFESTSPKMKISGALLRKYLEDKGQRQSLGVALGATGNDDLRSLAAAYTLNPPFPLSSAVVKFSKSLVPLQLQFNSVCKSIEIPEEEFNYALELFKNVRQLFLQIYPNGNTIIFRNYYLRLRNTGTNTLLIYAFAANPFDDLTFLTIPIDFQLDLPPGFRKKWSRGDINGTIYYEHQISKFRFHFVTFPLQIVEAQLSLLVQYLCCFDHRLKGVLTLVYFWARSHQIKIAEEEYPDFKYHSNCPEPVALEWMVILFLIREGVMPSVREILEREHVPLVVGDYRHDVGFSMEMDYPEKWRRKKGLPVGEGVVDVTSEQFVLEVVKLAGGFFEFFGGNLERGDWLLNPKDGEIIKREGTRIGRSGLSEEEKERLAIVQGKESTPEHLIIGEFRIFMLNPLYVTWKLSFDVGRWTEVTCGEMRRMGEELGRWMEGMRRGEGKGLSLEEVLAGGRGNVEEVRLELSCEMNQNLRAAIRTKLEQRKRSGGEGEGGRKGQGAVKKIKK